MAVPMQRRLLEGAPARPPRFRLVAAIPSEDELHASVAAALDRLLLPPAEWTTFPSGGYALSEAAKARLYRLGLKPGWPDVLVAHAGRIHGIELKARNGRLSRTRIVHTSAGKPRLAIGQADMHERLQAAGMPVAVCRSVEAVLAQLREWGVPLRGRIAA